MPVELKLLSVAFALVSFQTALHGQALNAGVPWPLRNMPMNSERRCVGIASVAEALMEGNVTTEPDSTIQLDQLAQSIFEGLSIDKAVTYPAELRIGGTQLPITEPEALNALSTRVATLYKAETNKISANPEGRRRLEKAYSLTVSSKQELHEILDADKDRTEVICCFGYREFPTGTYKETYHAVVMHKANVGTIKVFDPNDPGRPVTCTFGILDGEFIAEWKCGYRDRGFETTQTYQLVPKSRFFRAARERTSKH